MPCFVLRPTLGCIVLWLHTTKRFLGHFAKRIARQYFIFHYFTTRCSIYSVTQVRLFRRILFYVEFSAKISIVLHNIRNVEKKEGTKIIYSVVFCLNLLYSDNLFCVWSLPRPDSLFTIVFGGGANSLFSLALHHFVLWYSNGAQHKVL